MTIRMADLYAGVGGFRLGCEEAGWTCVYTAEKDKFARQTYLANWPGSEVATLVPETRDEQESLPDFDVLCAGFPCQPFSPAVRAQGYQPQGFADKRGEAIFDIANILEVKRPSAFMLENVPYLLKHDGGKTINTILQRINVELGYFVYLIKVDCSRFVPQSRKRLFIVGFDWPAAFWQEEFELRYPERPVRLGDILEKNPHPRHKVSKKSWTIRQQTRMRMKQKGNNFFYKICGPDDTLYTLVARHVSRVANNYIETGDPDGMPRYPTPRECFSAQGFPSTFKIPVSDHQAYLQAGNAVVVPVVNALADEMTEHLLNAN